MAAIEFNIGRTTVRAQPKTEKAILNYPEVGIRLRATMGENVIVGSVERQGEYSSDAITLSLGCQKDRFGMPWMSLRPAEGWSFEVIE